MSKYVMSRETSMAGANCIFGDMGEFIKDANNGGVM
jgi:hypothetical protein